MFQWLWTAVWSAVMLPLGAALIAGRVPLWMRRQSTPGGLKVKGMAAFVLYAGLMVPPLTTLSGMRPEDADFVRMVLVPTTVFSGHGLILGATLCERFNRRETERAGVPAVPATSTSGMPDHRGTAT